MKKTIPLTVPKEQQAKYLEHYQTVTKGTGHLFLFAGDQKIEHLNQDFHGKNIPEECGSPLHLFDIASTSPIGCFATQLGLIARYGADYPSINYLVKLNSKTNLVPATNAEPISKQLWSVEQVATFAKESGLSIVGVGYTVYLGSEHEADMLQEAAQIIVQAHQKGMIAILWMYPRGKAVENERSADVIAGAAGVAACLGADFVKLNAPQESSAEKSALALQQATRAAGRTGIIISGGAKMEQANLLDSVRSSIQDGGAHGCAVGRNIHQNTLDDAQKLCGQLAHIVYGE